MVLSALGSGNSAGFGIDQVNARAGSAGHRMIGGAVIVGPGVGGMSLDVVAGSRAAIDESGHQSLVGFAVRLASPENYVKYWVCGFPSGGICISC